MSNFEKKVILGFAFLMLVGIVLAQSSYVNPSGNIVTTQPPSTTPYSEFAHDAPTNSLKVRSFDGAKSTVSNFGLWSNGTGELCLGKDPAMLPMIRYFTDTSGGTNIQLGPNTILGAAIVVQKVSTQAVFITSGASLFSAAPDGTPIHAEWVSKGGGRWALEGVRATDAELAAHGKSKADFTPKN